MFESDGDYQEESVLDDAEAAREVCFQYDFFSS